MNLFRNESDHPKYNAQRNLMGRTHYVDNDGLRYHKSRVLKTVVSHGGMIFSIVESCAADPNGYKRIFRPVIFDIFGTVLFRPKFEDSSRSRRPAEKAMWKALDAIDAKTHTLAAIDKSTEYYLNEMAQFKAQIERIDLGKVF
jgi:hypothetical protein